MLDANRFLGGDARAAIARHRVRRAWGRHRDDAGRSKAATALITGANQGLGLAIARAYVEAGASVLLCARDATLLEQARARGRGARGAGPAGRWRMPADVSQREDVERAGGGGA